MEQPAFTKSRTPAGGGSPYTEGTLCFAILQELSGVARALLSAGAVPPQTPRDLRSQTGFAGRLQAGVLHIQREHCALPFCRNCPGSPERCSPQGRLPHKRPVTCGHRPASPDACGRDFRCAVAPLKCGRNLRFPHKRPLPLYTHDDLQRAAPRMSRRFGKNYLTKSGKFTVRSLIHSFSFTTWW